jgi:hypothetical protein
LARPSCQTLDMLHFDESLLLRCIEAPPMQEQSAFAQACAWRAFSTSPSEVSGATHALCRLAQELAYDFVATGRVDIHGTAAVLAELLDVPELDDDGLAACSYVARHLLSGEPQEVVWAARRAYEAIDQLAQTGASFTHYSADVEAALLRFPGVQAELAAQTNDLLQLQSAANQGVPVILRAKEDLGRRHV